MPCQVQGEPQPNIKWFLGTTPLPDSDKYSFQGGALIVHNLTREDEGRYECRASNGIDTIQSVAVLKVKGKANHLSLFIWEWPNLPKFGGSASYDKNIKG